MWRKAACASGHSGRVCAAPSLVQGDEETRLHAFLLTLHLIRRRLELLINLPLEHLVPERLQGAARQISG